MLDPKKLAEARKKNKLSQTRAAYKLNTTRQSISGWERGEHERIQINYTKWRSSMVSQLLTFLPMKMTFPTGTWSVRSQCLRTAGKELIRKVKGKKLQEN